MASEVLKWQAIDHGIRERIVSGDLQIGNKIPSTEELKRAYGASLSAVRQAVNQLKAEGILEGFSGKGVFVAKVPKAPGATADLELAELTALRGDVARIEANLVDLFGKLGYEYEHQAPKVRKQRRGHG
ncbi:MAG: winged helix-turn-helix domain-containing protein [Streptosporangiaceae bacterium]